MIGSLTHLIRGAAIRAILDGQEAITRPLLDSVRIDHALASVLSGRPGRPDDGPARSAVEIAIYPDVMWLAARSLREHSTPP